MRRASIKAGLVKIERRNQVSRTSKVHMAECRLTISVVVVQPRIINARSNLQWSIICYMGHERVPFIVVLEVCDNVEHGAWLSKQHQRMIQRRRQHCHTGASMSVWENTVNTAFCVSP